MSGGGKVGGGTLGFMLGGPLGALVGAVLGHNFDRGFTALQEQPTAEIDVGEQERIQAAFFTATFAVMGHLAKADGHVSEHEISLARGVMAQMRLTSGLRKTAIGLFSQGKQPGFDLDGVLDQFRRECHGRRNLIRMFLEIQLNSAHVDGVLHPEEERILQYCCLRLGFTAAELRHLEDLVRAADHFKRHGGEQTSPAKKRADAYAVLGVSNHATDQQVKMAYRRMMNQHHPDKLVARGLPEQMIKLATEKTQEIKAAYGTIKNARKNRQ